MRVLHLFSNWKLTGPAEPAVNLAAQCAQLGHDVSFITGAAPEGNSSLISPLTTRAGIHLDASLTLSKHRRFFANRRDSLNLRSIINNGSFDIMHCHMANDTRIAISALKGVDTRPKLIRTLYYGNTAAIPHADKVLLRSLDGLSVVSAGIAEDLAKDLSPIPVTRIDTAVDLVRFDPSRLNSSLREKWQIEQNAPVIGVVGRLQSKRRFDIIFQSFKDLLPEHPKAKLVIVGRGTRKKEVAKTPPIVMGIQDSVVLPGYIEGDDYVRALASFDILVYLVPGTDGSCRTVREAMAMALPVVSSRRGILPELVEDGVTGRVCEENAAELTTALSGLIAQRDERTKMSANARKKAERSLALETQASRTLDLYHKVLAK